MICKEAVKGTPNSLTHPRAVQVRDVPRGILQRGKGKVFLADLATELVNIEDQRQHATSGTREPTPQTESSPVRRTGRCIVE